MPASLASCKAPVCSSCPAWASSFKQDSLQCLLSPSETVTAPAAGCHCSLLNHKLLHGHLNTPHPSSRNYCHHLSCCLLAMGWAFSCLNSRLKCLGIKLNSCLQFHCWILSACCTQHHAWKRREKQILAVMGLHHLKTVATSVSPTASSRGPQLHHKDWEKLRNLHLDYFLETFYSCLLELSLVESSVCEHA